MKNLIGYSKKILSLFSLLLFFSLSLNPVDAAENFNIYSSFNHTIQNSQILTEIVIRIESETPKVITYYTASIPIKDLQTDCYIYQTNEKINCTNYYRGSHTDVLFDLKNSVVRPSNPLEISIRYKTDSTLSNAYNILSKVEDAVTESILIQYPKEKGEPLWTSDSIQNLREVKEYYQITINKPVFTTFSLLFGEEVYYKFNISRVFSNALQDSNQTFELLIPPDSSSQTIIWEEISPLPNSSVQDSDGNYIFKYIVPPNQSIDCKLSGYIRKNENIPTQETQPLFLTKNLGYWDITNTSEQKRVSTYMNQKGLNVESSFDDILTLEKSQREVFYKYLYKYVVERLNYNKEAKLGIENSTRLGANTTVESNSDASGIDYADFYIALLRKYNIPSRLAVGYVSNVSGYTSDGFYHNWVEYYNVNEKKWVTVDPFLEDYFSKDLYKSDFFDHIVVLRRGKSTVSPTMTFYNTTDFQVEYEYTPEVKITFDLDADLAFEELQSTDSYLKGYIYLSNTGNVAINGYSFLKSNINDIAKYVDPVNNINSQIILPKQNAIIQLNVPYSEVQSTNVFNNMRFSNSANYSKDIYSETNIKESIPVYITFLSKILSITIFSSITFLIYFLSKKLKKNG